MEPFEAGIGTELPPVRNGHEQMRRAAAVIVPTKFTPELVGLAGTVLGTSSDTFLRKVSQEMVDTGFLFWTLNEAKGNETPVKLAYHLLKTAWRPGWIDEKAEKEQAAKTKFEQWLQEQE